MSKSSEWTNDDGLVVGFGARVSEEEDFKVPNWDVKMASLVGERKMIRFIKKLIPSDQYVEDKLKAI